MRYGNFTAIAMLGIALLFGGCGGGSGRYTGTDVVVAGVGPASTVLGGETATFSMTVTNAGAYEASNLTITNLIGNQLALTGIGCTASGGAVCPSPTGASMTVPSIPVSGSLRFEVTAIAVAGANGIISNTMNATFADDNDRSNNVATASGTAASNNLGVTASAPPGPLIGGAAAQFAAVVSNAGPATANNVEIANVLSSNLTLAGAISCAASGGAEPPLEMSDGSLRSASIPSGGALTCSVPVVVTAGTNGLVSSTMTVSAAGDQRAGDNSATASVIAASADLGVSQTGADQISAGNSTQFTAVVANAGPGSASNVVIQWTHTEAAGLTFAVPTCTASGGAVCPAVLGPTMTVPSLPVGRSLTLRFNVGVAPGYRGGIVNTVAVTSDEDQTADDNTATTTTTAIDPRNGSYSTFSANGRPYTLTVDFDSGQYSVSGGGFAATRNFSFDPASGDYVVAGNVRFRVATDLIVGGDDFGGGVLPYVAARGFASSVASAAGSYDLATRNLPAVGAPVTHAATALISGNTLSICQSDSGQVVPVRNCAPGARTDYVNLRANGNVITGVSASGEAYSFSVADSGALRILLSAGQAPDGSQQMRVGIVDSAGGPTYGPPLHGPSSTGDWLAITLSNAADPPTYSASGTTSSDSASLQPVSPGGAGPFSMLTGTSLFYNAAIYVTQGAPLVIVVGGVQGAASGLLQLALP